MIGRVVRRAALLAALLAAACLCGGACTTDEVARGIGQTLYNAGRYVCTQSKNCDVPADDRGPDVSPNRR